MKRLFLKRIFLKSGPPLHLIWFITGRCNLQCSHCFRIEKSTNELSFNEIEKTISHLTPLLSVSLTGGEPFLRDDIVEIAKLLARNRLTQNIVLFTNGFLPNQIITAVEKTLLACSQINISLGVSIDGFEKEHDTYRNRKGSYKNAIETLEGLKKLKSNFSNFSLGVGITLHSGNQGIIHNLRKYIYDTYKIHAGIILIRGEVRSAILKKVNTQIFKEVIDSLENERKQSEKLGIFPTIMATRTRLGQMLAYETLISGKRNYPCFAGSLMGVIYENGDVFPCEMLNYSKLGNLREADYNLNKIWQTDRANKIRKWISTKKCACTYECQFTCNTLYNINFFHIFLKDVLRQLFTYKEGKI